MSAPVDVWRSHVRRMPGRILLIHVASNISVTALRGTLSDLEIDLDERIARDILWTEVDARLPARNAEDHVPPHEAACNQCDDAGDGGKRAEVCPQCHGEGTIA